VRAEIKTREGIWQPCLISSRNLQQLKARHKKGIRFQEEKMIDNTPQEEGRIKEVAAFLKSKGYTKRTVKTYCSILRTAFHKLGLNFTEGEVEHYLAYRNLAPRSYNLNRAVINFYTEKYLGYSLKFTKAKVPKTLPKYVSRAEINRIIFHKKNIKHKLELSLMYSSGLRTCEVIRLKKHNFDLQNFTITIRQGKGKKDRQTIIKPSLIPALKKYLSRLDNNDYLFPSGNTHIAGRTVQEVLKAGKRKAEIKRKFGCHDLRHSFAANCLDAGIDIEDLRKMLGHTKLSTTQIYLQCRKGNLKQAAMKLEGNITKCVIE